MRKILFLLTTCMALFASCSNEKNQFDEDLQVAYQKMVRTFKTSTHVCSQTSNTWRTAIYDNKTPSGKYCNDFNKALEELFGNYAMWGALDSIISFKDAMQAATSKLNDPPSNRKDCYDDFVEIVSEVSSLSRMATDPSGSLRSYYDQVNETEENISKKLDQFKIKYAQFLNFEEESEDGIEVITGDEPLF